MEQMGDSEHFMRESPLGEHLWNRLIIAAFAGNDGGDTTENHPSALAGLTWAFWRPSGSHMEFNHSNRCCTFLPQHFWIELRLKSQSFFGIFSVICVNCDMFSLAT